MPDVMEKILEKGADVNAPNEEGMTPLHFAVMYQETKIVEMLMKYDADPMKTDRAGRRPYDMAMDLGLVHVQKLFKDKAANKRKKNGPVNGNKSLNRKPPKPPFH